jgi:molecular chaperone DnaK
MIHTAEKAIKDAGDKVTPELKKEVEDAIADTKSKKDSNDLEAIKKATEALSSTMMKIGEAMKTANDNATTTTGEEKKEGEGTTN